MKCVAQAAGTCPGSCLKTVAVVLARPWMCPRESSLRLSREGWGVIGVIRMMSAEIRQRGTQHSTTKPELQHMPVSRNFSVQASLNDCPKVLDVTQGSVVVEFLVHPSMRGGDRRTATDLSTVGYFRCAMIFDDNPI